MSRISPPYTQPKYAGSRLLVNYYQFKYGANIRLFDDFDENEIVQAIAAARNQAGQKGEHRVAFLVGMKDFHASPLIYIKEGEEEGLLIVDSIGLLMFPLENMNYIQQEAQIYCFFIRNQSQVDTYSCFLYSLIIARDCTSISTREYQVEKLLSFLRTYGKESSPGVIEVMKLPDALLKTAQRSLFFSKYHLAQNLFIHQTANRNETLIEFRNRYTEKGVRVRNRITSDNSETYSLKNLNVYLRDKGNKIWALILLQHYINQLNSCLINPLTREETQDFTINLKRILGSKITDRQINDDSYAETIRFFNRRNDSILLASKLSETHPALKQ